ncbi:D-cysteine desulfhydrase family protein [Cyclobacterium sp. 1_MG-2023]|uniref:D-cysteine desulfhydrase family protein n=1 Tax=Cyclobacterium sp. 1_MG-2023 TaxID=3062681 RepID=UPI0026E231AC|nr:D-cysteine desulfhydrase family protein [Cyclobacterium sp. 1_MG-2023]MDO6437329.1 D-cysteine desulfhydrase family protein [Cyclobacterium sp. 1_MG-2023]
MIDNKFNLGFFPTPLQELRKLSKKYPDYNIFIKRDDNTGLASGGNKTRKLEYLIKQALEEGCDTIITAGAQQSNHCRQTAAACSIAGLNCYLLLGGEKPEVYDGNLLLSSILGAEIHFTGENRKGEDIEALKNKLENKGNKCFVIPYGGSNVTGAMGFVNAVKELKEQLIQQKLKIDYIFFASSSGGMQAGLTLGKEIYNLNSELIPISIDKEETNGLSLEEVVFNIVKEGLQKMNVNKKIQLSDIYLNRDYDKGGYGVVTKNEINSINELARNEGILLDPVYTGRAFYGMLDYLKEKKIPSNSNVLFWHTGGLPAIFKYANELK